MFTGIVTDIGEVAERDGGRFWLACGYAAGSIALGASIACDGCCLTVTSVETRGNRTVFAVEASNETLGLTTLSAWRPGQSINLERALALGAELGGHLMTGHVDGLAKVIEVTPDGTSTRFRFAVPPHLARFIAQKGSVALDGTSLTVNEVEGATFGVNIIPHTLAVTTWGARRAGDSLNLEVDLLARYVARLASPDANGLPASFVPGAAR
jgi:riboflavin synthase